MAWSQTGDRALSELMMAYLTEASLLEEVYMVIVLMCTIQPLYYTVLMSKIQKKHNVASRARSMACKFMVSKPGALCNIEYARETHFHYHDVIMGAIASKITSLTIVYSTVYSDADQIKQSSASVAFVRGIHKWPVTRKMFPFVDVIMKIKSRESRSSKTSVWNVQWFWNLLQSTVLLPPFCEIPKQMGNWVLICGQTKFHEIWV